MNYIKKSILATCFIMLASSFIYAQQIVPFGYSQDAVEKVAQQIPGQVMQRNLKFYAAIGAMAGAVGIMAFNFYDKYYYGTYIPAAPMEVLTEGVFANSWLPESITHGAQSLWAFGRTIGGLVGEFMLPSYLSGKAMTAMGQYGKSLDVVTYLGNNTSLIRLKGQVDTADSDFEGLQNYTIFKQVILGAELLPFTTTSEQMKTKVNVMNGKVYLLVNDLVNLMGYLTYRQNLETQTNAANAVQMQYVIDELDDMITTFCFDVDNKLQGFVDNVQDYQKVSKLVVEFKDLVSTFTGHCYTKISDFLLLEQHKLSVI